MRKSVVDLGFSAQKSSQGALDYVIKVVDLRNGEVVPSKSK